MARTDLDPPFDNSTFEDGTAEGFDVLQCGFALSAGEALKELRPLLGFIFLQSDIAKVRLEMLTPDCS